MFNGSRVGCFILSIALFCSWCTLVAIGTSSYSCCWSGLREEIDDIQVVRRTRDTTSRRHYVMPQPKAEAGESKRGRRRLRTTGEAVGTKEGGGEVENLADMFADLAASDGEKSEKSDGERTARSDDRKTPEESRPLAEVITGVGDIDAQEALERLRVRQLSMESRLMSVEYHNRAQQSEIDEMRVLVGPCMRIFPPKGSAAAWVRAQLSAAYWSGAFGSMVVRILSEYGIPYTFALASHSCEVEVANICRQKVPYCWPMMYNSSKVGLQEAQCHDARQFLKSAAERYAEQDNTEALRFLYGYPMERRRINADGKLSDDDDWSVEVLYPSTNTTAVLMVCLYDHENCRQRYIIDARVVWDMTWTEEDLESCVRQIVGMYKPCVEFIVESDDPVLSIRGKRRFKELQAKGKGAGGKDDEEINLDRTNNGIGKSAGIPQSMQNPGGPFKSKGGGKVSGKSPGCGGGGGGKASSSYGQFGKQKGSAGFHYKGKGVGQQMPYGKSSQPIGVDGGFAPQGYGAQQQHQVQHTFPPQPPAFDPMALMQQFFSQAMGKGKFVS